MDLNDIESAFFERLFPVEMDVPINAILHSVGASIEMVVTPRIDQNGRFLLEYANAAPHVPEAKNDWFQWGDDAFGTHPVLEQAWMNHNLCSLTLRRSVMLCPTQAEWTIDVEVTHPDNNFRGRLALARNRVKLEDTPIHETRFSVSDFPDCMFPGPRFLAPPVDAVRKALENLLPPGSAVNIQLPPREIILESGDGWIMKLTKEDSLSRGLTNHTGVITRSGGKGYSIDDLQKALEGLTLFLAFVRGDYCHPTAVIGYVDSGEEWGLRPTWGRIGHFKGEPRHRQNWFVNSYDVALSTYLERLFPKFWQTWSPHQEEVGEAIDLYVRSGHSLRNGNPGSAISESYAGLESLAGVCRNMTISNNSAQEIAQVLQQYDVPLRMIDQLPSQQFGQLARDIDIHCQSGTGVDLLNKVRNYIPHPLARRTSATIKADIHEALRDGRVLRQVYLHDLSQFYFEHLLLAHCGYGQTAGSKLFGRYRPLLAEDNPDG